MVQSHRTAHEIALRQTQGKASTEDLRQAMIHYRSLFGELVSEPTSAATRSGMSSKINLCTRSVSVHSVSP